MTKHQLYFVVAVLGLATLYLLFKPTEAPTDPDQKLATSTGAVPETSTPSAAGQDAVPPRAETDETAEPVELEGVFVGLAEDTSLAFADTFEYLLFDDGTEIIRIDLRPLIGYDKVDVPAKLGVERGDRVTIRGVVNPDGQFVIASINRI